MPLAEKHGGPTVRYTSRAVIEAELHVVRAADALAGDKTHAISDSDRAAVLGGKRFEGITREQARAFQHATAAEGLALIDGQAGTGKSNNGRRSWNEKTVVIVDEAAMLDTKLMAMVTAHAHDAGAKLILVGDDRQLSSIDRGGMFGALKDRNGPQRFRK